MPLLHKLSSVLRQIYKIIAEIDLIKAFKACEINEDTQESDYCKFFAIETLFHKYDPKTVKKILEDSNACKIANFFSNYYQASCKDLSFIINASVLAQEGKEQEAIDYCDQHVSNETLYDRNICYNEIALIIGEYDLDTAKLICNKIPEGSINYAREQCRDRIK